MPSPEGTTGKASSGARFVPPPATIWNNMVDAGRAFADQQLSQPGQPRIRPRDTDLIKIQNTSGALRRAGEILKIDGKALDTITAEFIWLLGVEPTTDCYFGILKSHVADDGIETLQVSGVCIGLVDIQDTAHTRAKAVAGEYVLTSGFDGPLEILYAPASTGEQTCVVRWAFSEPWYYAMLDGDLAAAVSADYLTASAPTATASIYVPDGSGGLTDSGENVTVINRFGIDYTASTFGILKPLAGEWFWMGGCGPLS